jgi:hypothetical protein
MKSTQALIMKFSVNNWNHLYSLEQAILRDEQATGKDLTILGVIRNENILDKKDAAVCITFKQVDNIPKYNKTESGQIILGQIKRCEEKLESTLAVSNDVFEELRKNLMEYADIDGIHIVVSLGFISDQQDWEVGTERDIVKLDYAMKGDA